MTEIVEKARIFGSLKKHQPKKLWKSPFRDHTLGPDAVGD
jgi:hypothetical protein